jgi:hypothetical protein
MYKDTVLLSDTYWYSPANGCRGVRLRLLIRQSSMRPHRHNETKPEGNPQPDDSIEFSLSKFHTARCMTLGSESCFDGPIG